MVINIVVHPQLALLLLVLNSESSENDCGFLVNSLYNMQQNVYNFTSYYWYSILSVIYMYVVYRINKNYQIFLQKLGKIISVDMIQGTMTNVCCCDILVKVKSIHFDCKEYIFFIFKFHSIQYWKYVFYIAYWYLYV